MKRLWILFLVLTFAAPAFADSHMPGKGIKVQPARATWNTGYFQEALVRAGLKELGYDVGLLSLTALKAKRVAKSTFLSSRNPR